MSDFRTNITPMPIPTEVGVHGVTMQRGDEKQGFVRLSFATHQGASFYFIPVDTAKEYAELIIAQAQQTMSGLIVPKKGLIVPDSGNGQK